VKYKKLIAKSFKEKLDKIEKNKKLENFNWDSLTKISLITDVHNMFNKNLDIQNLIK
jgi:acyl carrier protein